jgi:hypothetical protein
MQQENLELSDAAGNSLYRTTVGRYVHSLRRTGTSPMARLYAAGWRFFEQRADMLDDFDEPIPDTQDLLQRIPERLFKPLLWLFMGPDGSGTALHYDVLGTHAWLAVIEGKKRLALHPPTPSDDDDCALRETAQRILLARNDCEGWRYLEISKGDLLFIPANWWHQVVNEGPTIGLTRNFVSHDILGAVTAHARGQGHLALLSWLHRNAG